MKDNFKTFKPAGKMQFEFTDLISGYVSGFNADKKSFTLTTSDGRAFNVLLGATTYARLMRNLDEPYQDATGNMYDLLAQDGRMVFAFGIFYPKTDGTFDFEAKQIDFPEKGKGKYRFRSKTGGQIRRRASATSSSALSSPTATSITTTTAPL